jgi:CRP/FNR family transcriptional regulator
MTKPKELQQYDVFSGLNEEQLKPIAELAEVMKFKEGKAVFEEGKEAAYMFVLVKGKVRIQVQLTSSPENIALSVLSKPGTLIGWSGMLPGQSYTAAAICLEDTELLAFDGQALIKVLEKDCYTGFMVFRKISEVISGRVRNIQRVVLKTI